MTKKRNKMKLELSKKECTHIIDALIFLSSEVCYKNNDKNNERKILDIAKKIKKVTGCDCKYVMRFSGDEKIYDNFDQMKKVSKEFDVKVNY